MKIIRKNFLSRKSAVLIACFCIVVTAGLVLAYSALLPKKEVGSKTNERPASNGVAVGKTSTVYDAERASEEQKRQTVEKNLQDNATSQASAKELSIATISKSQNNGIVQMRFRISGLVGGTCLITVKNGDRQKNYSADIQALASFSSCAGFDIPVSDLLSGAWDIRLVVNTVDSKAAELNFGFEAR